MLHYVDSARSTVYQLCSVGSLPIEGRYTKIDCSKRSSGGSAIARAITGHRVSTRGGALVVQDDPMRKGMESVQLRMTHKV